MVDLFKDAEMTVTLISQHLARPRVVDFDCRLSVMLTHRLVQNEQVLIFDPS